MKLRQRNGSDIARATAGALHRHAGAVIYVAQLQILCAVVAWITIDVVHGFSGQEHSTEQALHHDAVFEHVATPGLGLSSVRMFGHVNVDVSPSLTSAFQFSAPGKVPVLGAELLPPVAANEWVRVPRELPQRPVGLSRHDLRFATAATFAQPGRNFIRARDVAQGRRLARTVMARQEPGWVVASALRRGQQSLSASTLTKLSAHGVDHALDVTTAA